MSGPGKIPSHDPLRNYLVGPFVSISELPICSIIATLLLVLFWPLQSRLDCLRFKSSIIDGK